MREAVFLRVLAELLDCVAAVPVGVWWEALVGVRWFLELKGTPFLSEKEEKFLEVSRAALRVFLQKGYPLLPQSAFVAVEVFRGKGVLAQVTAHARGVVPCRRGALLA